MNVGNSPTRRLGLGWIAVLGLVIPACDGGGSSGSGTSEGIALPSEISAVSARSDAGDAIRIGNARRLGLASTLRTYQARVQGAVGDLPADSDYHSVQVRKFVEIKVLDVFQIIDQIFDAFRQTHYSDHVGDGWYKCMVAFEDEGEGGVTQTSLEEWYVRATNSTSGGETVTTVNAKIVESDGDETELIRVEVTVEDPPTENADGTLADLGVWEVRARFGDVDEEDEEEEVQDFFHATASVDDDGLTVLTVEDQFVEDFGGGPGGEEEEEEEEFIGSTRAVIYRSLTQGYGVAEYPNWEACWADGADPAEECPEGPPSISVSFSYNENYLSVQVDDEDPMSFDRTDEHEIVHRYMLFNSDDGSNVENDLNFGFPVRTDDGSNLFGWYGAWQDRHQLWMPGDSIEDGTTVVRNDGRPESDGESYTTRSFDGALTRVELVTGSLDQLEGIAAEIWLFDTFRLRWNDDEGRWDQCTGDDGFGGCDSEDDFTESLESLELAGESDQRNVFIDHCEEDEEEGFSCTQYVYDSEGDGGFFEAEFNEETGRFEAGETELDTEAIADGYELWCSIGGRTYIQYTGEFDGEEVTTTGWVEKTLTDFDFSTWTPSFDDEADRPFRFELGRQYFINNRGANLRVTKVSSDGDEDDFRVFMEDQTVAKPTAGLATVYPEGTVLVNGWDPDSNSTYALNVDPEDDNYLLLEFVEVSDSDAGDGFEAGDIVTQDLWGLRIDGDDSELDEATLYNWEYQTDGEFHGGVSYLLDEDSAFVLVSDPVRLQPVALPRTDDLVNDRPEEEWLSYSLQFDGWLHGLPDTWFELEKVNYEGDRIPSVLAKNVRIPDGTEVTNAEDGETTYYVKAVDVGIFLGFVDAFPGGQEPDLSLTDDIDLDEDLPTFTAPDLDSTIPEGAELLYVEGIAVE